MTEPAPVYSIDATTFADPDPVVIQGGPRLTPSEGAAVLAAYLMHERDTLISRLRMIDRLLGRPQTIPERNR